MATPEELLADDGSALVPPHMAAGVFAVLWRHCKAEGDRHGAALGPDMHALLLALHRAASAPSSASATPTPAPATVDTSRVLGVAEAAELLGCSRSYVRRLCHAGRIPATPLTGGWVIEAAALDDFRHGRTAHAHDEDHLTQPGGER
jgi:excisionase family DNA binding protein